MQLDEKVSDPASWRGVSPVAGLLVWSAQRQHDFDYAREGITVTPNRRRVDWTRAPDNGEVDDLWCMRVAVEEKPRSS